MKVTKPIQVTIVEDDADIRASLAALISTAEGFRSLETYPSGEAALKGIPRNPPDVVLMDINLPGMNGIECVRQLRSALPALPILMLTVYDDGEQLFQSLMAGANGYLLKRTPKAKLLDCIGEVLHGGAPMSRQIARKVVNYFHLLAQMPSAEKLSPEVSNLTAREQEILANLAKGYSSKEIANALGISSETVRNHMRNIYEKLHVHSRTEALLKYLGK